MTKTKKITAAIALGAAGLIAVPAAQASTAPPVRGSDASIQSYLLTNAVVNVAMRGAPLDNTYYTGTALAGHQLLSVCFVWDGSVFWDLVVDQQGTGGDHFALAAGYVRESALSSNAQGFPCDV